MKDFVTGENFYKDLEGLTHVGRYTITRELGRGGMAVVYLGRDPFIQRRVAIKMALPRNNESKGRFFVEAQSAGRLNHPNVVAVHDAGVHDKFCYITMEYVGGKSLEEHCQPDSLLPTRKALEIMFSILNALDYAHRQGVIHRDIKPANVLLTKGLSPKISDFGIARVMGGTITQEIICGTPSYMSPEQVKGEDINENTDLFSAGCVMYELLTGKMAYPGKNHFEAMKKIVKSDPPKLLDERPDLPQVLEKILQKALKKDPMDRYQSCLDMAFDLRVAMRGVRDPEDEGEQEKPKGAVDYIRHVPFFHNFKPKQVEQLFLAAEVDKYKKGRTIVTQGEIDDTFYIILSGQARIIKDGDVIATVGTGECFGEMAYIGGQARVATVIADTDCVLMRVSATLLDRAPGPIQLLFFKNFAFFLVKRFSMFFNTEAD